MKRDKVDMAKACETITGKDVKEFGMQTLAGYTAHDTTVKVPKCTLRAKMTGVWQTMTG